MINAPLVSVVIPAYNGEKTVGKAVLSVVRQTYRPLELIVIDDASKDLTSKVVKDVITESDFSARFELVRHEVNLGLSRTLNDGLREAHGDFVLILHQDCELIGDDWVRKALSFMKDDKVAVVTGYYGLPDREDETFVKRAFGVLRRQFHKRPEAQWEEVTFSEGKCDLYRKDVLLKVGGFPTNYRIAGEDLIMSYGLRKLGYKIIKCYEMPVIQRFGGAAESFCGNLGKEFLFGKVMGGVFLEFKLFVFKGVNNSKYSGSRSLHRASQPVFVLTLAFFALFCLLFAPLFSYFMIGFMLFRYVYYFFRVSSEIKRFNTPTSHFMAESLAVALIGLFTDFAYGLGFGYGFIRYCLKKEL